MNVHERIEYKLGGVSTGVCVTRRLGTSLINSFQPLMLLLAVFVYDPLTWIVSLFLTADGLFITLARQSGTHVAR